MGKIVVEFETDYNAGDVVIFEKNDRLMVGIVEGYYMGDDIFWFNIRVSSRYVLSIHTQMAEILWNPISLEELVKI